MSAQEVIEKFNALPPEDRQEVITFVREQEATYAPLSVRQPDWDRIIEEVFDEHDELFRKLAK